MSWFMRLGMLALVLGIILKLGPCFAETDWIIDIYEPETVPLDEFIRIELRQVCSMSVPPMMNAPTGTCLPPLNCTADGGMPMYANNPACTNSSDVCCTSIQNTTMPTATMPTTPAVTQPGMPNCNTPNFDATNPGNALQPNCSSVTMPSAPTGLTIPTTTKASLK